VNEYSIRITEAQIQAARETVRRDRAAGYEGSNIAVELIADAAGKEWRSAGPARELEPEYPEFDGVHPYVDSVQRNMPEWASYGEPPRYTSPEYVALVRSLTEEAKESRRPSGQDGEWEEGAYEAEGMSNVKGTPGDVGSSWDLKTDEGRTVHVQIANFPGQGDGTGMEGWNRPRRPR